MFFQRTDLYETSSFRLKSRLRRENDTLIDFPTSLCDFRIYHPRIGIIHDSHPRSASGLSCGLALTYLFARIPAPKTRHPLVDEVLPEATWTQWYLMRDLSMHPTPLLD